MGHPVVNKHKDTDIGQLICQYFGNDLNLIVKPSLHFQRDVCVQDPSHRRLEHPQGGSVLQGVMDHLGASEARQPAVPGQCLQRSLFVCSIQCLAFAYQEHYCLK